MTTLNFGSAVSLKEAASLVMHCPDTVFCFQGEPGIGKSSMMRVFEEAYGDNYSYAYIDCATIDLGDIAMPAVDHTNKITEYYPNARFQLHTGKPVIIMLDEFGKAPQPVQNMLHPLLESRKKRLGDRYLPEGSRVFIATNLSSDNVGDNLKAHTRNRVAMVNVRKPDADEWLEWGVSNNVEGVVMAWVNQFPHCLASYTDGMQESNPYVFNPKKVQTAYVSPRSLEGASRIVRNRDRITDNALTTSLTGTLGEAAARDMQAFIEYQDQLPSWEAIIKSPHSVNVPDSPGACAVMVFGAIQKVDKDTITPFMTYVERFEPEWQAAFAINLSKNPDKQRVAYQSPKFRDWCLKNEDIL